MCHVFLNCYSDQEKGSSKAWKLNVINVTENQLITDFTHVNAFMTLATRGSLKWLLLIVIIRDDNKYAFTE